MNWKILALAFLAFFFSGLFGCAGLNAAIERASIDSPGVKFIFHTDFGLEIKSSGVDADATANIKDPGEGEPETGDADGG